MNPESKWDKPSYYDILNVSENADREEIAAAYRQLAL
jgi:DnaJ-class molecular chaperone